MSFEKYKNDKFYKAVADHLGINYNSQSAFNKIKNYAKKKGVLGLDSQNDLDKIFSEGKYSNSGPEKLDVKSNDNYANKIKGIYDSGKKKLNKFKNNSAIKSVVDQSVVNLNSQAAGGVRMRGISGVRKAMLRTGFKAAFNRSGKRIKKIKETFN